jgi:putative transport protein
MGAAQQAYSDLFHADNPNIAAGYALAYPFSIIGVILSMLLLRRMLRISLADEQQSLLNNNSQNAKEPVCVDVKLAFGHGESISIRQLHKLCPIDMIVSRIIRSDGSEQVADGTSVLSEGDTIRVLTDRTHISALEAIGSTSVFRRVPKGDSANLVSRRIVVTKPEWNGRKIGKVAIRGQYHVNITRVIRAGVNLLATPDLTLQLGDRLIVVGEQEDVKRVAELFGNELRRLDTPHLVPVFLGMALGVVLGTLPIVLPGGGYCMCVPPEANIPAMEFYNRGMNVFVLTYTTDITFSVPLKKQPLSDAARAVRFIRKRDKEYNIMKDTQFKTPDGLIFRAIDDFILPP